MKLLSYYGGKARLAKYYPAPKYDTIVEPFAGAAGYSCYWHRKRILLWEKNPKVFGALQFLIQSSKQEILSLPLLAPSQSVDDLPICEGANLLIGFHVNDATASPCKVLSKWGVLKSQRASSLWSVGTRRKLGKLADCIKHWKVTLASYETIDVDAIGPATWFVDPPYKGKAGSFYPNGSTDIDYEKLAIWCQSLPGQVIVCEQSGADWLSFRQFRCLRSAKHRLGTEVIWTKGCSIYPSLFGK